jgi:UDP-N-acetyl-D-galactosamine dehydrogenase
MTYPTVAVVGLGYVGLPLAVAFGKKYKTIGFDHHPAKIRQYRNFHDPMGEVSSEDMRSARQLAFTDNASDLSPADVIVIAVPTPVDDACIPDFGPLVEASKTVGSTLKQGALVVYESTVYPGATEEICIPVLERSSGKTWKRDFSVGYSPERVNPGDKERTLTKITKVVAGDSPSTLERLTHLYGSIIAAGIHQASSIKVAEAAKVIENTQRDLNIALMNELALIFDRLNIDTTEVLEAAGTKWNFMPFRPGLVGGHCIGVDPYYLTHKAEMVGYHPQVILAGRRINDGMAPWVAQQTVKKIIQSGGTAKSSKVIVLGLTFKEDCPDLRNSKVAALIEELTALGCEPIVHDPIADPQEAQALYGCTLTPWQDLPHGVDAVVAAVAHRFYRELPVEEVLAMLKPGGVVADVKSSFDPARVSQAGFMLWRL